MPLLIKVPIRVEAQSLVITWDLSLLNCVLQEERNP